MDYREVEEEVLDIAHYVTGREPGSIVPGHYFVKLMEGTVADFALYIHELIE